MSAWFSNLRLGRILMLRIRILTVRGIADSNVNDFFTSYYWLYPERFGRLLLILLIGDEVTYYHVDVISTGQYYDAAEILFYGTLIRNLLPTSYVTRTNSSSDVAITNVCKYSGTRLLQSTYLILLVLLVQLLFFLWHMYVMLYSVTCHCIF